MSTVKRITIVINTTGAAFDVSPTYEIGQILGEVAYKLQRDGVSTPQILRDASGNICGTVVIETEVGE